MSAAAQARVTSGTRRKARTAPGNVTPLRNPAPKVPDEKPEETLFDQSDILDHIRRWAEAMEVRPEAALAVVLARLASNISHRVVLPKIGSKPVASLNLYVALEGKSGSGKNALIDGVDDLMPRPFAEDDPVRKVSGLSTGEGLLAVYVKPGKDADGQQRQMYVTRRAFVLIDEIGMLEGVASRTGNTLMPVLRSMWSGAGVDTPTADPTRQRALAAQAYRLSLVVGIQPGLGGVIFDQAAKLSGMPQRFLFAKVANPLDVDADYADDPGPLQFTVHKSIPYDEVFEHGGRELQEPQFVLPVDGEIVTYIRRQHRLNQHEDPSALDGHWLLVRLRVAALLAILHGQPGVDWMAWDWADVLMNHGNQVRRDLMDAIEDAGRAREAARGRAEATRGDAAEDMRVLKVQQRVLEMVAAGKHSRKALQNALSGPQREVLDRALLELGDVGRVVRTSYLVKGGRAVRYDLPEG